MDYKVLMEKLLEFRKARDWEPFHDPKNLAIALSIEAGELMEHFLWVEKNQIADFGDDKIQAISEEIADVFIYLSYLAYGLGINVGEAVERKMLINAQKYSIDSD
jgi:NTP pyrophosphatase (non-canonical NTP hydrolase)